MWKFKDYFWPNCVNHFFFKILYCIFDSSYDVQLGSVLEAVEKLWPFARRSVSNLDNCLQDKLTTHFFLSAMLSALCVPFLLLIKSSNFCISLFFVKSKDFLYEISWIFSTRWNSSGVIDSKILPFTFSKLFLSLSRITWLVYIRSCDNILPACCKMVLLHLFFIQETYRKFC